MLGRSNESNPNNKFCPGDEGNSEGGGATESVSVSSSSSSLSDELVNGILMVTALMPLLAAFVSLRYQVGKRDDVYACTSASSRPHSNRRIGTRTRMGATSRNSYDQVATKSDENIHTAVVMTETAALPPEPRRGEITSNIDSPIGTPIGASISSLPPVSSTLSLPQASIISGSMHSIKLDVLTLLLFQFVLIMIGLRTLIVNWSSIALWNIIFASLLCGMFVTLVYSHIQNKKIQATSTHTSSDDGTSNARTSSPQDHIAHIKRIAAYLILRHATPSASIVGSFTYSVFRSRPLYLQTMSLLGSATAVLSTWTYSEWVARSFASIPGIKRVIAISTIMTALCSLITVAFVVEFKKILRGDGAEDGAHGDNDVFEKGTFLVICYSVYTLAGGFISEISFLPSVVLATNSIVFQEQGEAAFQTENSSDDTGCHSESENGNNIHYAGMCMNMSAPSLHNYHCQGQEEEGDDDRRVAMDSNGTASSLPSTIPPPSISLFSDGVQYGLLIACIDFGDQVSEFLSIPIIEILDIRRDNNWHNLEWLVVVCSILSITSLVFLRLLRG